MSIYPLDACYLCATRAAVAATIRLSAERQWQRSVAELEKAGNKRSSCANRSHYQRLDELGLLPK